MTRKSAKMNHLLKKASKTVSAKPYVKENLIHKRRGVKQLIKKVDSKTFITVAVAVISAPAYAEVNDAADPDLSAEAQTQIEKSITDAVTNKINEIIANATTAAIKPSNITSNEPDLKNVPQLTDHKPNISQPDIPNWNSDSRSYTAAGNSTVSNDPKTQRYTLDLDSKKDGAFHADKLYIKHNGLTGTDTPYHGAAIHV